MYREFPIIEFDSESSTIIDIEANIDSSITLPNHCVISFFGDSVKRKIETDLCSQVSSLVMESFELPIYECSATNGKKVAFLHGLGGGPYAAGQIEKLCAMGCNKYIVCGGCGVLTKGSNVGDILIPASALRDEGTSYHYIKPSRTIDMDKNTLQKITNYLKLREIDYKIVKTWTTDAMYRETINMIQRRYNEGCQTVEMECASFLAVGKYRNVEIGQLLYAGDDLSCSTWFSRNWKNQADIRSAIFNLSIEICSDL